VAGGAEPVRDERRRGAGRGCARIPDQFRAGCQGAQVVIGTIQRVYSTLTGAALTEDDEGASSFQRDAEGEKVVAYNPAIPETQQDRLDC
jgi:type I restriction enzyme R subunit